MASHCPANARKQHFYNLGLSFPLLVRDSLDVGVHGDFQSSVTEQFLNDFIGIQDRAEGVTKRVPADALL